MYQEYNYTVAQKTSRAVTNCYLWMFLGLWVTALTSVILYATNILLYILYRFPYFLMVICIAELAVVIGMSALQRKLNSGALKGMFILYAFLTGVTFTSLGYAYDLGTISVAFGVSAVYFLCLFIVGKTTKKDFTNIGMICIAALFSLVISQLVMMLFGVQMSTRLISILGLLIFTGITIFDVQRAQRLLSSAGLDYESTEKMTIFFALQLYLDFINIFLYILRLVGSKSKN